MLRMLYSMWLEFCSSSTFMSAAAAVPFEEVYILAFWAKVAVF